MIKLKTPFKLAKPRGPGRRISSQTFSSIPTINIKPFIDGTDPLHVVNEVREAASKIGFFTITGHQVPSSKIEPVYAQMREFFAKPDAEKMKIHVSKSRGGLRGYIGFFEQGDYGYEPDSRNLPPEDQTLEGKAKMDAKEVFTMGPEPTSSELTQCLTLFDKNQWPNLQFQNDVMSYYTELQSLKKQIFSILALALDLPGQFFDPLITHGMDSMNMIHYPAQNNPKVASGQLGIGGHTDFECFTLLSQNNTKGLEIWNGDEWVSIPPLSEAFVVNIGDMMARWSNDVFKSTIHRATCHPNQERYSIACFCACNYDANLECLVKGAQPKYPPVIAGEHLLRRINRANNL